MKRAYGLLLVWLSLTVSSQAAGLIIIHEPDFWRHPEPHPLPPFHPLPPPRPLPPPPRWAPLEVTSTMINATIKDQIATTHIDQEFYNPNARQLEGTFLFPVPKGAHLDRFTMEINGQQVQAELLEADKARGIYEDIVRKLNDPALLEYAGRDLFKVRIFPIEPQGRKRITLDYSQLLKSDGGLIQYVFPLNTEKYSAKPLRTVGVKINLESKRPLKSIYSPSHRVEIARHGEYKATVGFEAADLKPEADFQLWFAQEEGQFGLNLVTHRTGDQDGYFLLLASPGAESKTDKVVPKDIAFVLDTSGSMSGPKLEQAKKALAFCVENLNDADRFEVMRFATEAEPLFNGLVEANEANRQRARDFIKQLKPIGGTAIFDALQKALALRPAQSDRPYVVIFLTDGRPTVGNTDENHIVNGVVGRKEGLTRIFCFGIGTDVNTHLLDRITEETKAFSQYVLPEEDIEVKVSNFFTKIKEPALVNPKLVFPDGIRVTKMHPSTLPDVFRGEQVVVVGRYSAEGGGSLVIEGTVAGQSRRFHYDATFPKTSADHEFIPRLWATRRVGYLLDEIRLRGESPELKDEATQLARQYGIVTPYTAYLIVEDERRRGVAQNRLLLGQPFYREESLRQLSSDFKRFSEDRSGDAAVAGARALQELNSAQSAPLALSRGNQDAARGTVFSINGVGADLPHPLPDLPAKRPKPGRESSDAYADQARFVGGRTFFQKDNRWVDGEVQKYPEAIPVRIQFNSTEYFNLVRKHPEAAPWLALGRNVQFVLDATVYDIFE